VGEVPIAEEVRSVAEMIITSYHQLIVRNTHIMPAWLLESISLLPSFTSILARLCGMPQPEWAAPRDQLSQDFQERGAGCSSLEIDS